MRTAKELRREALLSSSFYLSDQAEHSSCAAAVAVYRDRRQDVAQEMEGNKGTADLMA